MAISRRFNWISSSRSENFDLLTGLDLQMTRFYSDLESRVNYQEMVDKNDNNITDPGIVTEAFLNYLKTTHKKRLVEVGCGSGRIYQFLEKEFNDVQYTGIEVSPAIIEFNRYKFPKANWVESTVYKLPFENRSLDFCFSFYVLEHLVFPEKALQEMLRVLKDDGKLILIFPDFVASGRFSSQMIGFSNYPTARQKLKKGRIFDAIVSLYDSRIRLPEALKKAVNTVGSFPVNYKPKCLYMNDIELSPDIDAVYIASKKEIENWAVVNGLKVQYPVGKTGYFSEHAFIEITKEGVG